MYKPKVTKKQIEQLTRWAKIAGRVAGIAVHIRGKPRMTDWLVLGAAALDVGLEIHAERERERAVSPWHYFEDKSERAWDAFPISLTSVAFKHVGNAQKADVPVDDGEPNIYHGMLGAETVGWSTKNNPTETPIKLFYKEDRHAETMKALADVIWNDFQTTALCYTPKGLTEMLPQTENLIDTAFIETLQKRCAKWLAAGKHRGYLLEGPPGTGKSTCIRRVIQTMDMKSLHIELGCLDALSDANEAQPSINTVIRILQPDALIIDDVDRVSDEDQPKLLFLLERARAMCKVVFVTVNDRGRLLDEHRAEDDQRDSALLRPGRLDEHIIAPPLEGSVVRDIIGEGDDDLVDRMRYWPIAYVVEYAERKTVLGHEQALAELGELERRARYDAAAPSEAIVMADDGTAPKSTRTVYQS